MQAGRPQMLLQRWRWRGYDMDLPVPHASPTCQCQRQCLHASASANLQCQCQCQCQCAHASASASVDLRCQCQCQCQRVSDSASANCNTLINEVVQLSWVVPRPAGQRLRRQSWLNETACQSQQQHLAASSLTLRLSGQRPDASKRTKMPPASMASWEETTARILAQPILQLG